MLRPRYQAEQRVAILPKLSHTRVMCCCLAVVALSLLVLLLSPFFYGTWRCMGLLAFAALLSSFLLVSVSFILSIRLHGATASLERTLEAFADSRDILMDEIAVSNHPIEYAHDLESQLRQIRYQMVSLIEREYQAKLKQNEAEISALQGQINPHFLYNTLDAVRGLALINDDAPVADMVEALSTFFRYSISQRENTVTLQDEIENINSYLVIQNYRFSGKIHFSVSIEDENNALLRAEIPKLTLQPIIENAVYHGLEPKVGDGHIVVRLFHSNERLLINIQDDGIGMSDDQTQQINRKLQLGKLSDSTSSGRGNGIALINIDQRIKLNYGKEYGLTVSSTRGIGTEVIIAIPFAEK